MGPLLGLPQVEPCPPDDDLLLVRQVLVEDVPQGENLRLALVLHQGQHVDGEGRLQLRLGEQAVEHHLGVGVLLQLDDDAHAGAVGFIADVADAVEPLAFHLVGHVLDEHALVDLVGDFGDDDPRPVLAELFELRAGTDDDPAVAGGVRRADAAAAHDDAAGGEIGAVQVLHQVGQVGFGVVQDLHRSGDGLPQVVGRDVRGHAYGDTRGAVDQQVWEAGRKDPGLLAAFVEVGIPVDGLLVDVPEHLRRHPGQAGLGVPVGGRRVAVHGAEVAVAVHQGIPHGEVLGQADERVVDGAVPVGMVSAQHVADASGRLLEGLVMGQIVLVHGVENPAVHRLEAVAHVRQSTADDDRHGVLYVGFLHLLHQRRGHDGLIRVSDLLGIVLWFFAHIGAAFLFSMAPSRGPRKPINNPDSPHTWRSSR